MQAIRVTETEFCIYFLKQCFYSRALCKRAAMQNFAEFQCRSETDWQHFTEPMKDALNETSSDDSRVGRTDRWTPRSWVACCVCTMQAWQEERVQAYIAGDACCFSNFQAVADLLNPDRYIRTWPMVPAEEIRASAVDLQMPTGEKNKANSQTEIGRTRKVFLHKRRVTERMCCGKEQAHLCHDCYNCMRKAAPEMPVNALANGRWLGRHPEIMRSMPYGHRLLLPVRRVVLTRVIFTANPKSEWERSHSQKGLHGVTAVVEQAEASSSILEYPPENLGESFQAVFSGIDPDDTRKAQCFRSTKRCFSAIMSFCRGAACRMVQPDSMPKMWKRGRMESPLRYFKTILSMHPTIKRTMNSRKNLLLPNTEDLWILPRQSEKWESTRRTCLGAFCVLTPQTRSLMSHLLGK